MAAVEMTPNARNKTDGASFANRQSYQAIRVTDASLLGDRCVFENMPHHRSVELCHVIPKYEENNTALLDSLEYNWGLRYGTLNLDTRYNGLFAGATLHHLFDHGGFTLLPSAEDLQQMSQASENTTGSKLPTYFNEARRQYTYRLVPLTSWDRCVAILRLLDHTKEAPLTSTDFTIHTHPFSQMVIQSHIKPHFVVIHFGKKVAGSAERLSAAFTHLPSDHNDLEIALDLYNKYTAEAPEGSIDRTIDPHSASEDETSDIDSTLNDPDYVEKVLRETSTEHYRFSIREAYRTRKSHPATPTRPSGSSKASSKTARSAKSDAKVGDKRQRGT
ncbi:hypothetical protein BKA70DRAFT_503377 [Coprinopsis sp. MPI-PUGE-AT-0042]|nr:hypothetical protein BKA70DRAFT_503377 [Coprinopsis sp. MPI-PUGE-AT-0042]